MGDLLKWYVLRVTYQRELAYMNQLTRLGIESFIPMARVRHRLANGRIIWRTAPAVHNYIFIHSTSNTIQRLKNLQLPALRFVMCTDNDGIRRPQVVPEKQMNHFIAVAGNEKERIKFLRPGELNLSQGDRVRILSGPFEGVEGTLVKIHRNNKNEQRVVVQIDGIISVATSVIPAVLVEKI